MFHLITVWHSAPGPLSQNKVKSVRLGKLFVSRCVERVVSTELLLITNLDPKPYLVFSNGKEIRELSTNFHDYKLVLKKTEGVTFIDADIHTNTIYWANEKGRTINRVSKGGSKTAKVIVKNVTVASLSLDWISQKLYWIDSGESFYSTSCF